MDNERTAGGLRCSEVLAMLSDYVDGELTAAQVAQVEQHVAACDNCFRFGGSFGNMLSRARQHSERATVSAELRQRLEERLRGG